MWLDICICIFFLLFGYFGWRKGFLRNVLGFVSSLISFALAIFLANPLANLFDSWFGLSDLLNFNKFVKGRLFNVILCAIIIFIAIRFIFFMLSRLVKIAKADNKKFSKADSVLGLILGLAKAFFSLCILSATVYAIASIPLVGKQIENVFNGSYIGTFIYDIAIRIVYPLFKTVADAVGNSIFG